METTDTELNAIAAPATHGARSPNAAIGIPAELYARAQNRFLRIFLIVNLAIENAKISYDEEKVNDGDIVNKIEEIGYSVMKEKTEFDVHGMTCATCAGRIEKGLNRLNGIGSANINLATESGVVEYNPGI